MMEIKHGVELPKKRCRGRPPGTGRNIDLLKSLKPGDTVWNIGTRRMNSIVASARAIGIKLVVRKIPGTRSYAFQIHEEPKDDI